MLPTRPLLVSLKRRYGPFVADHLSKAAHQTVNLDARSDSGNVGPSGGDIIVFNPSNGEHLTTVTSSTQSIVRDSVRRSHEVFMSGIWSRASAIHRSRVLSRLARSLEEHVSIFARMETLQTGRAIREMNAQLGRLPEWLDYYAALLRTHQSFIAPTQGQLFNYVTRVPLGVVVQITPFNHPLLIAVKKIAPALAAGNSVIVKPSEAAPASVFEFAQLAVEAGVPPGVLSILPGPGKEIGQWLASDPLVCKVDITGGTKAGKELGSTVGGNLARYTAELGGKTPIVVFDDADVEAAVNGTAFACFVASGQTCVSGARVESFTKRIGNPENPESAMGTVISHRHLERISKMVGRSQGKVLVGGYRMTGISPVDGFDLSNGSFYAPTVIGNISLEDELWKEEVFGPVAVVKQFTTEEEAVNLANDSKYGLGAGLWTNNVSRAHRVAAQIDAGIVWVNTHHRNDPSSPWGGMKESGIGRENGVEAFEAYSQSKSITVNIADMESVRATDDWFADGSVAKRYG